MLDPSRVTSPREVQEDTARANPTKIVRRQELMPNLYSVHTNCDGELGVLISELLEEVSPAASSLDRIRLTEGSLSRRFLRDGSEREVFAVTLS